MAAMDERATRTYGARPAPIGPLGGFLERFRGSGGVPAAVGGESAEELAPLFEALDRFEGEARALRARDEAAIARAARKSEREAQALLAKARAEAEREREQAFEAGVRAAQAEAAELLARARVEASAIEERGRERLPALLADVLATVLGAGA